MKKRFIIYSLFLSGSFFFSLAIQAQEQKKPSERSFTTEINKVKQIQTARNTRISQTPQPTENTVAGEQDQEATKNNSTSKTQVSTSTKPSTGQMKQAKKPIVLKNN